METGTVVLITVACLFLACLLLWLLTKMMEPPKSGIDWETERRRPFRTARESLPPLASTNWGKPFSNRTVCLLLLACLACALPVGCGATEERDSLREAQELDDERKRRQEEDRRRKNEALAQAALEVREARREIAAGKRDLMELHDELNDED